MQKSTYFFLSIWFSFIFFINIFGNNFTIFVHFFLFLKHTFALGGHLVRGYIESDLVRHFQSNVISRCVTINKTMLPYFFLQFFFLKKFFNLQSNHKKHQKWITYLGKNCSVHFYTFIYCYLMCMFKKMIIIIYELQN